MSAPELSYQYVVLRCVPRADREEFVNVGVALYCQGADHLAAEGCIDAARLEALWPALDVERVLEAMAFVEAVAAGDPRAGAVAAQPLTQRFGYLKAPRSTVLQPGPVHGGTTTDPAATLTALVARTCE
ncbi:hypothetical protein ENKNEFLB_02915 [Nocardioides aquaticus]|uniref:DUF3037 domain-containing protein n=1 Tax=Nocardioides aquaticus TaxID=160826 RepID=A0ABX8EJI2_9ACTN|nr:DUF3037 domain-containing protein [Nocardioides aquaticus]QVT80516.1 hypothetical protein ENKNEFLB_02915 [Nocardioides aquaticus]